MVKAFIVQYENCEAAYIILGTICDLYTTHSVDHFALPPLPYTCKIGCTIVEVNCF
jgi:hypothetical protein